MKKKLLFKISCLVVIIVICVVLCHFVYLWATYIDETITSGEGYGFNIGESKEQVFDKTVKAFQGEKLFILYPLDERGFGPHKGFEFTSEGYELIKDRNEWEFYFTEGFFDLIQFTFKNEHLIEIHRHRQKFELP